MTALTPIVLILVLASAASGAHSVNQDSPAQQEAAAIVQQLRDFPDALRVSVRSDGTSDPLEQRRGALYERLLRLGADALPALTRGLRDSDVRVRRNVALVLAVLAGKWYRPLEPSLDIRPCLPALIAALKDPDGNVRARSAQAIGEIGADGARAIPELLIVLADDDEGSRIGACIALKGIGPAATQALPALRKALHDPAEDVRRFAQQAIERIQSGENLPR